MLPSFLFFLGGGGGGGGSALHSGVGGGKKIHAADIMLPLLWKSVADKLEHNFLTDWCQYLFC